MNAYNFKKEAKQRGEAGKFVPKKGQRWKKVAQDVGIPPLALADDHRSTAKSMTYNQFERCVVGGCLPPLSVKKIKPPKCHIRCVLYNN